MSKKSKMYQTSAPKSKKVVITIDSNETRKHLRNYVFVHMMQTCKHQVVESKKRKPSRYPHKIDYED